jgi:hypothetical protein
MEKIIQDQLGSLVFSGLLFFIQLYFRSILSEIKRDIEELKIESKRKAESIYNRLNAADKKIAFIEATCQELKKYEK